MAVQLKDARISLLLDIQKVKAEADEAEKVLEEKARKREEGERRTERQSNARKRSQQREDLKQGRISGGELWQAAAGARALVGRLFLPAAAAAAVIGGAEKSERTVRPFIEGAIKEALGDDALTVWKVLSASGASLINLLKDNATALDDAVAAAAQLQKTRFLLFDGQPSPASEIFEDFVAEQKIRVAQKQMDRAKDAIQTRLLGKKLVGVVRGLWE